LAAASSRKRSDLPVMRCASAVIAERSSAAIRIATSANGAYNAPSIAG
jgi:hypothetical protein